MGGAVRSHENRTVNLYKRVRSNLSTCTLSFSPNSAKNHLSTAHSSPSLRRDRGAMSAASALKAAEARVAAAKAEVAAAEAEFAAATALVAAEEAEAAGAVVAADISTAAGADAGPSEQRLVSIL